MREDMRPGDTELTEGILQRLYGSIGYDPNNTAITPIEVWRAMGCPDDMASGKNETERWLRSSIKCSILNSLKLFGLYTNDFDKYLMPMVLIDLDNREYCRTFLRLVERENHGRQQTKKKDISSSNDEPADIGLHVVH